jgi:type IV pilus assembly protein PilC
MLVLMLVIIGVLLVKVLPIFDDVYATLGSQLTGVAGGLLLVGRWMDRAMPVLWVILAVLALFFFAFAVMGGFRAKVLHIWRSRRGDKGVLRKINTARMVQALSMGVSSGMSMEQALELASELLTDVPDGKERCLACLARLEQGETLGAAMTNSDLLPPAAIRFLELGQRSGTMDQALEKLAVELSEDSEYAVDVMLGRVEPALVLVCALLVGMILLSVMLPLMHVLSAIG